jgi:hypothetical protein
MNWIKGYCSFQLAQELAARCPVRAKVQERDAIVTANVWVTTALGDDYYVTARFIVVGSNDLEAESTRQADEAAQKMIDAVQWSSEGVVK